MKHIKLLIVFGCLILLSACGSVEKPIETGLPIKAMSYTVGNEVVAMTELTEAGLDVQTENPKLPNLNDTQGKSVAFTYTFDSGETIHFMVTDGVVSSGDMLLGDYDSLVKDIKRHEANLNARESGIETQGAIQGRYCIRRFIFCQTYTAMKWENGIVYWEYPALSLSQREQVLPIIREFERRTDLRFVNRSEGDRIVFRTSGRGCNSPVGRIGGAQFINLNVADGCFTDAVIRHEIGHAIGMIHEHQRPDRDEHINIIEPNIEPGQEDNFQKINRKMAVRSTYDTRSIMHYSSGVFSIGSATSNPTITTKGGGRILYNSFFSERDLGTILTYYPR